MDVYDEPMLSPQKPALILAPMEGVTDAPMRALAGGWGAFTHAVSEFLRVSGHVPPKGVFWRHVPELKRAARTPTGLPVQVQLLGGDAEKLAAAALVALEAGAAAIDLNFGCPAKTVNRHDGGATLLKYPKRILEIVHTVRAAVPANVPVSAKLRLGWDDVNAIHENAAMAIEGGASWITIHARTRQQGYAPPVNWPLVGRIRESSPVPVIANGDIWTLADFRRCREETGCIHFMLGRGALADPTLPGRVAAELGLANGLPESDWPARILSYANWCRHYGRDAEHRLAARIKQWLALAARHGSFERFDDIKRLRTASDMLTALMV
jgi:tRNA-dihydrouridine synthase C